MMTFITEVIKQTPTYAWILLAFLIYRGTKMTVDAELSIKKMLIIPTIFAVWSLDKLAGQFSYASLALIFYTIALTFGVKFGDRLYSRHRHIYRKDGAFYRSGSKLPLTIMLINFTVKYILNITLAINDNLHNIMSFNILYGILAGFSVGLFFGGLKQAHKGLHDLSDAAA